MHEARDPGRVDIARQAAQVEAVGACEVDDRAVRVERLVELLEHAREELAHVRRVKRVEDDVEGAREALVRALEVVDRSVVLSGVGEPLVGRVGHEQIRLAGRHHRLAADRHGAKGAVEAAAHGGHRGAVEREGQILHRRSDARRRRRVGVIEVWKEALHVEPRHVDAVGCQKLGGLPVGKKHPARPVKDEHAVARELQKAREGAREAPLPDSFHMTPRERRLGPRHARGQPFVRGRAKVLADLVEVLGLQKRKAAIAQLDLQRLAGGLDHVHRAVAHGASVGVFDVEVTRREAIEEVPQRTGDVFHLGGDHACAHGVVAALTQHLGGRARLVADHADDAEINRLGDHEGVDLNTLLAEQVAHGGELSRAVGQAHGELIDHEDAPFVWTFPHPRAPARRAKDCETRGFRLCSLPDTRCDFL